MAYSLSSSGFADQTFIDYVAVADRYPDGVFDLLVIDGEARTSAFFRACRVVRIGGAILLDDSERVSYRPAVEAARRAGWPEFGRYGPKLHTPSFARTTIWTKTSELPSELITPPVGDRPATREDPPPQPLLTRARQVPAECEDGSTRSHT
jgi:hypothetical protein